MSQSYFAFNFKERINLFLELKGGKIPIAKKQIINTYTYFNKFLKESDLLLSFSRIIYIVSNSSVPQEIDKYKHPLRDKFGEGNYDISRNSDLGAFLRGAKY